MNGTEHRRPAPTDSPPTTTSESSPAEPDSRTLVTLTDDDRGMTEEGRQLLRELAATPDASVLKTLAPRSRNPNLSNNGVARRAKAARRRSDRGVGRLHQDPTPSADGDGSNDSTPQDPTILGVCRRCGRAGRVNGSKVCTGTTPRPPRVIGWSSALSRAGNIIDYEERSVKCTEIAKWKARKSTRRIVLRDTLKRIAGKHGV